MDHFFERFGFRFRDIHKNPCKESNRWKRTLPLVLVVVFPHLPGEGCWILCQLPAPPLLSSPLLSSPLLSSPLLVSSPRLLSSSPLLVSSPLLLLLLNHDHPRPVFPAGPQPRPSTPSVPCRTSTTTITAQCSLPDLNREYPRPVFPAGPQPRPSTPSVPCRTSTASIHAKCSLPDLM